MILLKVTSRFWEIIDYLMQRGGSDWWRQISPRITGGAGGWFKRISGGAGGWFSWISPRITSGVDGWFRQISPRITDGAGGWFKRTSPRISSRITGGSDEYLFEYLLDNLVKQVGDLGHYLLEYSLEYLPWIIHLLRQLFEEISVFTNLNHLSALDNQWFPKI